MRTDDVLAQIDTAINDWETSEDAMRCTPPSGTTPPETRDERGRLLAREVLARRLVDRHGLTVNEAADAVTEAERGLDGPHTHLVRAEARAVITEAMERIRASMQPIAEALADTLRRIGEAMKSMRQAQYELAPPPARRPDRPAWQSPYGPPLRRRRR